MTFTEEVSLAISAVMLGVIALDWARSRTSYGPAETLGSLTCFVTAKLASVALTPEGGVSFATHWHLPGAPNFSEGNVAHWALCLIAVDLLYYFWHRALHRVNVLWALHIVHHQPSELNYATGARTGWFTHLTLALVFLPLIALGFPPEMVLFCGLALGFYQFLMHTDRVGKLGPLEWVFTTPSQHRVHHAYNPGYLNRNYGGIFSVWDRAFGTFAPERERPTYGLGPHVRFTTADPIRLNLGYLVELARRSLGARGLRGKLAVWRAPPSLALACILVAGVGCAHAPANPWAAAAKPWPSRGEALGGYVAGCLAGAESLPPDGDGFVVMRPSRKRHYGHPATLETLRLAARKFRDQGHGSIRIGDLSQARGGPTLTGHRSHQSGLDADLWLLPLQPGAPSPTLDERENLEAPLFVSEDGLSVRRDLWTSAQTELVRLLSSSADAERVFVNAAIKRHLCDTVPRKNRDWLGRVRPWWGHDRHVHLRLRCPSADTRCKTQEQVPAGDGCDETLAWWFTEEARLKTAEETAPVTKLPELPEDCAAILVDPPG